MSKNTTHLRVDGRLYEEAKELYERMRSAGRLISMEDAYFKVKANNKRERDELKKMGWHFK